MKTMGYVRISTSTQDIHNQKLELLNYANANRAAIDEFMSIEMSSRKSMKDRRIEELLEKLHQGDTLIISELSRLGRSLGEVVQIVDELVKKGVKFISLKENMTINGAQDIATKVIVAMFGLFAEIERDLLSQRTKAGLANARASGKRLGRPAGSSGVRKLDGKENVIKELLGYAVSQAAIARKYKVSRTTLLNFIKNRNLVSLNVS